MTNQLSDYNLWIVALSYAVSVLGALVSLNIADYVTDRKGGLRIGWTIMAAVVFGGCAVWAMHFAGMLAYQPGVPITYDLKLTLMSLILPMLLAFTGFYVVFRWPQSTIAWLASGIIVGLGVAVMHYSGMMAMRMGYSMFYVEWVVIVSVLIAVVTATVALYIFVHVHGKLRQLAPLIMGLAVCGMHYTGMAAMRIGPPRDGDIDYFAGAWDSSMMAFTTGTAVTTTLIVGAVMVFSQRLAEMDNATGTPA